MQTHHYLISLAHLWNNPYMLHERLIIFDKKCEDTFETGMGDTHRSKFRLITSDDDYDDEGFLKNSRIYSVTYYYKDQWIEIVKKRIIELKQRLMITFINGTKSSESLHNFEDNQLFDKNLIPIIFNYVAY